jgi:D-tyrosyl-tRNA(Tyr) deacylase
MRAVVQRVFQAGVSVGGNVVGSVQKGLVIFLGVGRDDDLKDAEYLAEKITNLRIFEDESGLMNRSVLEAGGAVLVVSQFTLFGDCRKGRRPSFTEAAGPAAAEKLYTHFCRTLRDLGPTVATGIFQAEMRVLVDNHGPVTMLLDSRRLF